MDFFQAVIITLQSLCLFEPIPRDGHRMLPNYSKFNSNYYKQTIFDAVYFTKDFIFKGGSLRYQSIK